MSHRLSAAEEHQEFLQNIECWRFAKAEIIELNLHLLPNIFIEWTENKKGLKFVWKNRAEPFPIIGYIRNNCRINIETSIYSILFNQRGSEWSGLELLENYAVALAKNLTVLQILI